MLTEREKMIVAFVREAIDQGYPANRDSQCEHGRFYFEECIACYDAYLYGKLDAIERGEIACRVGGA